MPYLSESLRTNFPLTSLCANGRNEYLALYQSVSILVYRCIFDVSTFSSGASTLIGIFLSGSSSVGALTLSLILSLGFTAWYGSPFFFAFSCAFCHFSSSFWAAFILFSNGCLERTSIVSL